MNQRRRVGWLKHFDFMIIDVLCLEVAFFVAIFCRQVNFRFVDRTQMYTELNVLLVAVDLILVLLFNWYQDILKRGITAEVKSVLLQNIIIWGASMGVLFMEKSIWDFSRTVFVIGIVLSSFLMFVFRLVWKKVIRIHNVKRKNAPKTLVITTPIRAEKTVEKLINNEFSDFDITGVVLDCNPDGLTEIAGIPVVCEVGGLEDYVRSEVFDEAFVFLPTSDKGIDNLIETLLEIGIVVHIGLDSWGRDLPNSYVENYAGYNLLTTSVSTAGVLHLMLKRIVDILAGIVGCIFTGVLFVFVAPAIYKASPGPIFYSQERVGKNGRHFKIYKFRSMYMDADERKKELMAQNQMSGNMFKMENDPRIIGSEKGPGKGIGNIIRKFSIDEFPQFFNILKGDMSLVGTRPPTVDEVEQYDLHHMIRLSMKPGLTGMWQVSGRSNITDFEEVVKLDESYIRNWSLKLDLKIILKTFVAVFKSDGAE